VTFKLTQGYRQSCQSTPNSLNFNIVPKFGTRVDINYLLLGKNLAQKSLV